MSKRSLTLSLRTTIGIFLLVTYSSILSAQFRQNTQWSADGNAILKVIKGEIVQVDSRAPQHTKVLISLAMLTPKDSSKALPISQFSFSDDKSKVLLFTNTQRVWRYHTRGDYWVYDIHQQTLNKIGKDKPESSLKFAKFSPEGTKIAYVSANNLYVEDLKSGNSKQLTFDGDVKKNIINGTFDWVYEEEFGTRDGFRWSPQGNQIAYWKINGASIRNYLMLNTTDSTYSYTVPVEYPKAGEDPSACSIWSVDINSGNSIKMEIPGDPIQHYIPRMEWTKSDQLIIQQLNRKQNESTLLLSNPHTGESHPIYQEVDEAWIDIKSRWNGDDPTGWDWIKNGEKFIWVSEKDGWRHLYAVDMQGNEKLITPGEYDVIQLVHVDEKNNVVYFTASPENATEAYLYQVALSGGKAKRVSPPNQQGTHQYVFSSNGRLAIHSFSNVSQSTHNEVITLPSHQVISPGNTTVAPTENQAEFFKITTVDGIEMDGWMVKPTNFDPTKKYPVLFYVYGEPAGQTVTNRYGAGRNNNYVGNMADDGYLYISIENRGTPAPKGRAWRKSIYRKIGRLNIRDQAMGAKEILKWPFVDASRIAVWGSSGGGSSTLNLLSQYPEIYQTGISIAAVADQLKYDNIYQERYMGLPQENREDFVAGSPISHVKNLTGNLLYIHGTADDNVHYQNAELLINELVKHNKQFQLMVYPNRSHSLSEGDGTRKHLSTLFTNFLKEHCAPGAR